MSTNIQIPIPPVVGAPRIFMPRSASEMTFDARIPFELAARLRDPVAVLKEYGFSGKNAFELVSSPAFQEELKRAVEESIQGLTFRQRAKLMAPDALEQAYFIATDDEASDSNRLAAAQWIAKMADLEPKEEKNPTNNAFILQINMG